MFANVPSVSLNEARENLAARRQQQQTQQDRRNYLTDAEVDRLDMEQLNIQNNNNRNVSVGGGRHAPPNSDPSSWIGNRMKPVRFSKNNTKLNESCPICLLDYEVGDKNLMILKCNHVYHNECIRQWLQRDVRCPTCRFNLASLDYE